MDMLLGDLACEQVMHLWASNNISVGAVPARNKKGQRSKASSFFFHISFGGRFHLQSIMSAKVHGKVDFLLLAAHLE